MSSVSRSFMAAFAAVCLIMPLTLNGAEEEKAPEKVEALPMEDAEPKGEQQPVAAEPVVAEPAKVEPAKVEPAKVEPAKVEPAMAEPVTAEPVADAPEATEPVAAEPVVEPTPEYAEKVAQIHARKKLELEERIRKTIARLVTPGWKVAQADLIKIGKPVVPFLIEALAMPEDPKAELAPRLAYQQQGPIRATRNRPLAEVAYEVLHGMFLNNSSYKGKLPGLNQKAWKGLWEEKGQEINFGRRLP